MLEFIIAVQDSSVYLAALVFFAAYPIVTSLMWITTAMFFVFRWERGERSPPPRDYAPAVSILVPAYNEERVIADSLRSALALDYPDYEVIVIDDGSSDRTRAVVESLMPQPRLRMICKHSNEGKAMALNDALLAANGEIVLVLDADAEPAPDCLWHIVQHFSAPRVAAVTGNPRVKNVDGFLARLQVIEFSSVVSLLRRSQRIWGRIVTVSGVVAAFRRSAVVDVGGFSGNMATEDIELTWKLQRRFYDIRYEAGALVWMTVPTTLRSLYRQRARWARGLMQVLHKHRGVLADWRCRRMWPMFCESTLSTLWALCFVVLSAIWIASYAAGYPPVGASPIPNLWGMTIGTLCLLQLLTGALVDHPYDSAPLRYYPYAVYYPLLYWAFLAITAVIALPHLFRRLPQDSLTWNTPRRDYANGKQAALP